MMLLTSIDVVLRYIFNSPIPGVYSLVEMLIPGAVFPAAAYVQQVRGNVRVDIFIYRVTGNPRTVFELAIFFMAHAAFALMCWKIGILAWEAWVTGNYEMGIIEWPLWPPMTVMTLGLGFLCLRFVTDIKNNLIELKRKGSRWGRLRGRFTGPNHKTADQGKLYGHDCIHFFNSACHSSGDRFPRV